MVHLSQVPNDKTVESPSSPIVGGFSNFGLDEDDTFTASVYGSRYAAQDLPKTEMPEKEMPREVAYRMIKCVHSIDAQDLLYTGQKADGGCHCACPGRNEIAGRLADHNCILPGTTLPLTAPQL